MPTKRIWTDGAADGDFTNDSNWDTAAPEDGDPWVIPSSATPITQNLDQSAKTFPDCSIGEGVEIGEDGNPLILKVSGALVINGGKAENGALWIRGEATTGIAKVVVKRVGTSSALGEVVLDGKIGTIIGSRGNIKTRGGTVAALYAEANGLVATALNVTNSGAVITAAHLLAGSFVQNEDDDAGAAVTTLYQNGGSAIFSEGGLTNAEVRGSGSTFKYSAAGETVASCKVFGGLATFDGVDQTLTAGETHEGATLDLSDADITYGQSPRLS